MLLVDASGLALLMQIKADRSISHDFVAQMMHGRLKKLPCCYQFD